MNPITQNPYRVLGMFANDSTKVMMANIARIRAFLKVNKPISFDSDFVDIFGEIERNEETIEKALSKISNPIEAKIWSLFWIHRTVDSTARRIDITSPNKSALVNSAVLKLYRNFARDAVKDIAYIFEYNTDNTNLWEADGFWKSQQECSNCASPYVEILLQAFAQTGDSLARSNEDYEGWFWWTRLEASKNNPFWLAVRDKYKIKAKEYLSNIISGNLNISPFYGKERKLLWIAQPAIKILNTYRDSYNVSLCADVQLIFDKFSLYLHDFCKSIHETQKTVLAEPVLSLASFISEEVANLSYSPDTEEKIDETVLSLREEAKYLAPSSIEKQARSIKICIDNFCAKDDSVNNSLVLVKDCVSQLCKIKSFLGSSHLSYIHLCSRIADNAIYSANLELNSAVRKFNNKNNNREAAQAYLKSIVTKCCVLIADIELFSLDENFKIKFESFKERCSSIAEKLEIKTDLIEPNIILKTDLDKYEECGNDYNKLKVFVIENPDSPNLKDAMYKIWAIEDAAYPEDLVARKLFDYKKSFPNSHNEQKILDQLDTLLLGMTIGSIFDYRLMLQLWPNHPKKDMIEGRIDLINFRNCCCIGDWESYLKAYPNGKHRNAALKRIEEEYFKQCKTIGDYNKFILKYPISEYFGIACDRIEQMVYENVIATGTYSLYLKQYPNGKHVPEIRQKLEFQVFQNVLKTGKYWEYYKTYPKGRYTANVHDAEDDTAFIKCNSYKEYKNYLTKFPNGKHISEAHKQVRKHSVKKLTVWVGILLFIVIWGCIVWQISDKPSEMKSRHIETAPKQSHVKQTMYTPENDVYSRTNPEATTTESEYKYNSLPTGSRPYKSYFGQTLSGGHQMSFSTDTGSDYVVIVKQHGSGRHVDHIYIKGGDYASINLPDGTFDVYFYSGNGWNPYLMNGECQGGFEENTTMQKDRPVTLQRKYEGDYYYDQTLSYKLYPVYNGNLKLQKASTEEAF